MILVFARVGAAAVMGITIPTLDRRHHSYVGLLTCVMLGPSKQQRSCCDHHP